VGNNLKLNLDYTRHSRHYASIRYFFFVLLTKKLSLRQGVKKLLPPSVIAAYVFDKIG
jgi:hypothetical protein